MILGLVLVAAVLSAGLNFCFRKNYEKERSAKGFLTVHFLFSFLISFAFRGGFDLSSFSATMISIGMIAGVLNLLMVLLIARALQIGPSGLTFAFQNAGSMFPALFLYFLFGTAFGFKLDGPLEIGFLCLAAGLVLSVWHPKKNPFSELETPTGTVRFGPWLFLAVAIFAIQGFILSIFQWRSLLLEYPAKCHLLIPWACSVTEDVWFAPGFFLVPALIQPILFGVSEKRWLTLRESILGTVSGSLNGGSTFCLLMAARYSSPDFRPILFPLFAVGVIFLCNLWGKKFYQEPIQWKGLSLCIAGIVIGAL